MMAAFSWMACSFTARRHAGGTCPPTASFCPGCMRWPSGSTCRYVIPARGCCRFRARDRWSVSVRCWDADAARALPYFHIRPMPHRRQSRSMVSRTGWTGEMGFELYTLAPDIDGPALWNHLLAAGHGCLGSCEQPESMGIRRIEAGILDNGTDIDPSLDALAGRARQVRRSRCGRLRRADALAEADRTVLLHGILADETPVAGTRIACSMAPGRPGHDRAFSPHLNCGVGYARFTEARSWLGTTVEHRRCRLARPRTGRIVPLPFYDPEKRIPRGLPLTADRLVTLRTPSLRRVLVPGSRRRCRATTA